MKIKRVTPLNNGMSETSAGMLWDKVEGFAGYCFNKSHSCEYSVISYWTMWVKVNYPAEFFAAAMTIIDDDEKLAGLVLDSRRLGLEVQPPDINRSTSRIEIDGDHILFAPFQAVKGISAVTALRIMEVRDSMEDEHGARRPFRSKADFEAGVLALKLAGKINVRHRGNLERVGAFAGIEPETLPALHIDRLKDRIELMPGFTVDAVKATRGVSDSKLVKIKIAELAGELRTCNACSLKDMNHAIPRMGRSPKFMMVFDAPSWQEGTAGKLLEGNIADYIKLGFKSVGLDANDGYFTALVKAPKEKGAKTLTNEQIIHCSEFLKREIEILKPPVIVAMGSNAIRFFAPGVKGAPADLAGKVIFRPDLDASVVFGLNPSMIHFDPSKTKLLQETCIKLSELII